ncbi:MAG: TlpA family protein disulfide reductase [Bacteroidales bacterium]|nr:TlpA family protein disulfide reductase [Bacteroidales bacterium]
MNKILKTMLLVGGLFALTTTGAKAQSNEGDNRGYSVKVGDMAPDFTLQYLDGTTANLSDLRGKVVMLQFTAGWCRVCRQEMPYIEKEIWQKYKDNENFVLVAVDLKEPKEKVLKFIDDMKITYPLTLDEKGEIFSLYTEKNAGVTRNIVIDRDGKIVFLTRLFDRKEFDQMKEVIEKLLNK